jgi:hypothetical protein
MPLRKYFCRRRPCYGGFTYESKKNLFIAKKLFVPYGVSCLKPGNEPPSGPTPCQPAGNLADPGQYLPLEAVNCPRTGQPSLPIVPIPAIY